MFKKPILTITMLILCSYNLLAKSESSILDNKIVRADNIYYIEPNGKKWILDTTMVVVKLKPEIKTLPEKYVSSFIMDVLGFVKLKTPAKISFIEFVDMLKSDSVFFETMDYSAFGEYEFEPNDPSAHIYFGQQEWYLKAIKVYDAWDYTTGSSSVVVAVLDSGIDPNHIDIGLGTGTNNYSNIATNGWNFESNNNNVTDTYGHGTKVSGIISAKTNNGIGIAGIAGGRGMTNPGAKILPLKVGTDYPISGLIDTAIVDAVNKGAKIINMSFSVTQTSYIDAALQYAANNNVFLVTSSGNTGFAVTYPGTNSNVFTVGATDWWNNRASYSSYGSALDVVAPGGDLSMGSDAGIYTTFISSRYGYDNGTSMSAPIVSGVAALMLSINPTLTIDKIAYIIRYTSQKLGARTTYTYSWNNNGAWNNQMGYGLVDAHQSVMDARSCCKYIHNYKPMTTNITETGCYVDIFNVTVPNTKKLDVYSTKNVRINNGFKVEAGGSFVIRH